MLMYVPLRCTGTATETQASASTVDSWPQVGLSKATWATNPFPKNVEMRPFVLSKNWSGTRNSPGRKSSCSEPTDRKSTRLNSSHTVISYAVFCLKKKKIKTIDKVSVNHVASRHMVR